MPNPLFSTTSTEQPKVIKLILPNTNKNLGIKLKNHDKGLVQDMFKPSYASILNLLDNGEAATTINQENETVKEGDYIVAVNGCGFRRFQPDYDIMPSIAIPSENEVAELPKSPTASMDEGDDVLTASIKSKDDAMKLLSRVVSGQSDGKAYASFLQCIKEARGNCNNDDQISGDDNNLPESLTLTIERFTWDSRANSWERFLSIQKPTKNKVPNAMKMLQEHEFWKDATFPIDLTDLKLQFLLKSNAISELCLEDNKYPVLWVNIATILSLLNNKDDATSLDKEVLSKAFIIYIETLVSSSNFPKQSHVIDVSGVCLSTSSNLDIFQSILLQYIYNKIIQPNYPNIIHKLVFFPVNTRYISNTTSSNIDPALFVDEDCRSEFLVITDDLNALCKELDLVSGDDSNDILKNGGLAYLHQHLKINSSFIFD